MKQIKWCQLKKKYHPSEDTQKVNIIQPLQLSSGGISNWIQYVFGILSVLLEHKKLYILFSMASLVSQPHLCFGLNRFCVNGPCGYIVHTAAFSVSQHFCVNTDFFFFCWVFCILGCVLCKRGSCLFWCFLPLHLSTLVLPSQALN